MAVGARQVSSAAAVSERGARLAGGGVHCDIRQHRQTSASEICLRRCCVGGGRCPRRRRNRWQRTARRLGVAEVLASGASPVKPGIAPQQWRRGALREEVPLLAASGSGARAPARPPGLRRGHCQRGDHRLLELRKRRDAHQGRRLGSSQIGQVDLHKARSGGSLLHPWQPSALPAPGGKRPRHTIAA